MAKKDIHIVFQVLNFLHSDHHSALITSGTEHRVLINLASHKGEKGIFPSIPTIAHELKLKPRCIQRALKKWESLGIIAIEENAGKNNHYFLYIPESTPVSGDTPIIEEVIHTPVCTDTPPLSLETQTPVSGDTIYNKGASKEVTKKSLYMESVDNSKRHPFADSMDAKASEERHIRQHQGIKIEDSAVSKTEWEKIRTICRLRE